jgi:poly(3-hydroxybutyrate) depolymerase
MTACTPTRFGRRSARRLGPLASCLALLLLAGCGHEEQPSRLPGGGVDPSQLTVSGMSSGGYMAVQFHVAYSELVAGAGVLAAGPYYCAEDSLSRALRRCMRNGEDIPTDRLVEITSHLALQDEIDPIAGLARDRVWLFHGAADNTVASPSSTHCRRTTRPWWRRRTSCASSTRARATPFQPSRRGCPAR